MDALQGLTIVAFERRRAAELTRLLERHGAQVVSAPALQEVALTENPGAHALVDELEAGRIDAFVLLTGVGTRALVGAIENRCPRERFAELMSKITLIARGPKPVAALRDLGLTAQIRAPEPNTWRQILSEIDARLPIRGLRVAVQEYGRPNPDLMKGLQERGATTLAVPVYRWSLPDDLTPLRGAIDRILSGGADIVVFTTAVQLDHLLEVAGDSAPSVIDALRDRIAVASIGPSASAALRERGIEPAIEPAHPKLGYLAAAIADYGTSRLRRQ